MEPFQYQTDGQVIFGSGAIRNVATVIRERGAGRILLVTDPGVRAAGLVDPVLQQVAEAGAVVTLFAGVEENPTTRHVRAGVAHALEWTKGEAGEIELILAVGGGSAMDCAKGINFLLTNGGTMEDYCGLNKATRPMLPSVGIPTTAGTGSEAQSFALIAQEGSHRKMACGDRKARFATVILDPELLASVPAQVAGASGVDAVAHALETYVSSRRNPISRMYSREAWRLLEQNLESYLATPQLASPREAMMLGAYLGGAAIEASMLGAAHASANPLTARFGISHGAAVALMLASTIRFNARDCADLYQGLHTHGDAQALAARVEQLRAAANLPSSLQQAGVGREALAGLSRDATEEWTGRFNPRPLDETDFLQLYDAGF